MNLQVKLSSGNINSSSYKMVQLSASLIDDESGSECNLVVRDDNINKQTVLAEIQSSSDSSKKRVAGHTTANYHEPSSESSQQQRNRMQLPS